MAVGYRALQFQCYGPELIADGKGTNKFEGTEIPLQGNLLSVRDIISLGSADCTNANGSQLDLKKS